MVLSINGLTESAFMRMPRVYEKGAYISADSPYRTFFRFNEDMWPYNYHYDGWWGHDTLPKLNYEDSPLLFDYIMHIARKWVSAGRTMLTAGDLMWRQILVVTGVQSLFLERV